MAKQYARGSKAWGICARSGRKMLLKDLVYDGRFPNLLVDPAWREDRHPQETLPAVEDPIALYRPSPEVIAAPTAPVLVVVPVAVNLQLTWQPSETGITEIKSYDIYRGTDGGTPTLLINCPVRRDFLGGIKSIDHCTIANPPEHPDDPWTNVIEDSPVTYLDTTVVQGHTYCYYVIGNPLGNNQSTAQGPPSAPSNTACVGAPYQATAPVLSGMLSGTNVVLNWTAATITGSTITNYLLYRNVDGGTFSLFQTLGNVLTYTDTTTAVGHTYGYNVVGVPAAGVNSAPSNTVLETPVATGLYVAVGYQSGGIDVTAATPFIYTRAAGAGGAWTSRGAGGFTNGLLGVFKTPGGLWVALSNARGATNAQIATSPDGITWTPRSNPWGATRLYCGAASPSLLVVAGDGQAVMTSPDGVTWTVSGLVMGGSFVAGPHGLAYGGGVFSLTGITSGQANHGYSSDNGVTWNVSAQLTNLSYSVMWDGTQFVSVSRSTGNQQIILTSTDGNTWASTNINAALNTARQVAYNGSVYVVMGNDGRVLAASTIAGLPAGTVTQLGVGPVTRGIAVSGGLFVVVDDSGHAWRSPDGVTWTDEGVITANAFTAIAA